jgi:hypothetical protein
VKLKLKAKSFSEIYGYGIFLKKKAPGLSGNPSINILLDYDFDISVLIEMVCKDRHSREANLKSP